MPTSELQRTIDRITELITSVTATNRDAERSLRVTTDRSWVPRSFGQPVESAFGEFRASVDWALDRLNGLLAGADMVDAMTEAAAGWTPVARTMHAVQDDLDSLRPAIAANWEGRGGVAYADAVGPQVAACGQVSTIAGQTARTLLILAGAGRTFFLAAAVALADFAAAIRDLPQAVGSAFTAPAGVAAAAAAAAGLVSYLGRSESALQRQVAAARRTAGNLALAASDPVYFSSSGQWPAAATRSEPTPTDPTPPAKG